MDHDQTMTISLSAKVMSPHSRKWMLKGRDECGRVQRNGPGKQNWPRWLKNATWEKTNWQLAACYVRLQPSGEHKKNVEGEQAKINNSAQLCQPSGVSPDVSPAFCWADTQKKQFALSVIQTMRKGGYNNATRMDSVKRNRRNIMNKLLEEPKSSAGYEDRFSGRVSAPRLFQ